MRASRKDYVEIADRLNREFWRDHNLQTTAEAAAWQKGFGNAVRATAEALQSLNPRFDLERFMMAVYRYGRKES